MSQIDFVTIALVVPIAVNDYIWHTIPRGLVLAGFIYGIYFHWRFGGLGSALAASVVGFIAAMLLFQLAAIGGGDVKLIVALGALLGWSHWLVAMQIAIVVAAMWALIQAISRGRLRVTLRRTAGLLRLVDVVDPEDIPSIHNGSSLCAPFGVAAAVGTFVALVSSI